MTMIRPEVAAPLSGMPMEEFTVHLFLVVKGQRISARLMQRYRRLVGIWLAIRITRQS